MLDTELYRRTKYAAWSIRAGSGEIQNKDTVYARHYKCNSTKNPAASKYSWFVDDEGNENGKAMCYLCCCPVPEYIQALLRLYIGA